MNFGFMDKNFKIMEKLNNTKGKESLKLNDDKNINKKYERPVTVSLVGYSLVT